MKQVFLYIFCLSSMILISAGAGRSGQQPDATHKLPVEKKFQCKDGTVSFLSTAPLEIIRATSNNLRGVFTPVSQSFAWSVEVNSFQGFNNPLQREHFNENYLESDRYPTATFSGKIIEKVDFQSDGTYSVRAKGKLTIHGIEQERIIKGTITLNGNTLRIQSEFSVPLADHAITVPKIVHQKIAEEINVRVDATLRATE